MVLFWIHKVTARPIFPPEAVAVDPAIARGGLSLRIVLAQLDQHAPHVREDVVHHGEAARLVDREVAPETLEAQRIMTHGERGGRPHLERHLVDDAEQPVARADDLHLLRIVALGDLAELAVGA